jgi:hypothetical protein
MSLYNLIHGTNPLAGTLLAMLDLTPGDVGRFRDCFLAEENGTLEIHVYTRNGGGNRECWADGDEYKSAAGDCRCTGCVQRNVLPKHPLFVRDFDDDFDCTYATNVFRIPEQFLEPLKALVISDPEALPKPPAERFQDFLGKVRTIGVEDPAVARVMKAMEPLFEKLAKATG